MKPLHNLVELPAGKTIADVLPAYAFVNREYRIGSPAVVCAGCRKPFTAVRKRRKMIRLYPVEVFMPMALDYPLCGRCYALYQRGGNDREAILVAVDAFSDGEEASQ